MFGLYFLNDFAIGKAYFENGSESFFLSLKSSVRFNSLAILNQEREEKVSVSKYFRSRKAWGIYWSIYICPISSILLPMVKLLNVSMLELL